MADSKKLNMVLGILAVVILVTSSITFAYTRIPKGDADVVVVNGVEYSWDSVFEDFDIVSFTANDQDHEGIILSVLVLDAGVENPQTHSYRFTGLDGYQKDVMWSDVQNGYLVLDEHKSVFPGLTKSFWVKDLAKIEVV